MVIIQVVKENLNSAAKAFVSKAGSVSPTEMTKIAKKLGGKAIAKLGKAGLALGTAAVTGGISTIVILFDLLDIYDVATILIMMGIIE